MDVTYTNYDIDGWNIQFPQEWKVSLDKDDEPIQVIFDVAEESVTIYISTWNFTNPNTGELADAEAVLFIILQAFKQQGAETLEGFSEYYPEGFTTCMGKSATNMIFCGICTEGGALTVYFDCEQGGDFKKYFRYLKNIKFVKQE